MTALVTPGMKKLQCPISKCHYESNIESYLKKHITKYHNEHEINEFGFLNRLLVGNTDRNNYYHLVKAITSWVKKNV